MKRPVLAALAVLNIVLALSLAAMWLTPQGQWRNLHWTRPAPILPDYQQMLPALPAPQSVSTSAFLALLERPLFSSTRRPPPPPPPPVPAPPPDLLANAQLMGIYQSGEASGIIVRIEGKNRRIRLNESVNGWQLHSVQERAAVFTSAGQTRELPLLRAKVGSAVADPSVREPTPPISARLPSASPPVNSAPQGATTQPVPAAPAATGRKSRFGP